jgi:pantothenate kinase
MIATLPGQTQVDESTLADQVELQQAEIKRLRKKIDRMVGQQCEAADLPAAQCDSMRKHAELVQPHEVVAIANKDAAAKSPTAFEIQNLIQAQQELINKLQKEAADMEETPPETTGASRSN